MRRRIEPDSAAVRRSFAELSAVVDEMPEDAAGRALRRLLRLLAQRDDEIEITVGLIIRDIAWATDRKREE